MEPKVYQLLASDIVYEDNHILAIHKKAGQLVQADQTGDLSLDSAVKEFIKQRDKKPGNVYLGTLHRLDRPVEGLLLFAKTSKAAERMSLAFKANKIQKTYWALVDNLPAPPNGCISTYLSKDQLNNTVRSHKQSLTGTKQAITEYEVKGSKDGTHLLELRPHTGRPHQLRAHCAQELQSPIVGDIKYGSTHKTRDRSLYLCAVSLQFEHPVTKKPLHLHTKPLDKGFWKLFPIS
ncbi:MAG: RluA family pseudouridine synthase [Bacteroidetes bacterium]|jgi:23S rRNA pseudouridine1911/1915/1917 synthase|nr:RluA family pseudouridine synthase [Bacteroidota bacterium]